MNILIISAKKIFSYLISGLIKKQTLRKVMLRRICSMVMAIASVQSAFAANNDDLEQFIEQVRNEYQAPGVAVSIVQGDKRHLCQRFEK